MLITEAINDQINKMNFFYFLEFFVFAVNILTFFFDLNLIVYHIWLKMKKLTTYQHVMLKRKKIYPKMSFELQNEG